MRPGQNNITKGGLKPYVTLDMWRGIASLCVVMHHASSTITGRFAGLTAVPLYRVGELGYLGVQIFFVISGYCIAGTACSTLRRGDGWWAFMQARLRRVYPPLWFSLALIAAFSLLARGLVASGRIHGSALADKDVLHLSAAFYLSNLTLTQVVFHQSFLSIVCWTLCYEIAFYLIVSFSLIKWLRRKTEGAALTGLHLVTIGTLALLVLAPGYRFFPLDLWPQFGLGVLVYDVLKHPSQLRPKGWLLGTSVAMTAFILWRDLPMGPLAQSSRLTFLVTLCFALLILFLYRYDGALGNSSFGKQLRAIGIFSYSLYLTHFLTIGLVGQVFKLARMPPAAHPLLLAACLLCSLLVARLFYQFCERPFLSGANKHRPQVPVVAEAAAGVPSETVLS